MNSIEIPKTLPTVALEPSSGGHAVAKQDKARVDLP